MQNTGRFLNVGGELYALCEHDGKFFLYDPRHTLTRVPRANGLGELGAGNVPLAVGTTALSYVPVVGPLLSSLVGSLFGGGDPTPIKDIAMQAVSDRIALAQLRNAHGIPDNFDVRILMARYGAGDDQANAGPMVAQEILGHPITAFDDARHEIKRDEYKAAIAQMENEARALAASPAVAAPIIPGVTPTTPGGISAAVTPQKTSLLPWLLPAAALVAYLSVS